MASGHAAGCSPVSWSGSAGTRRPRGAPGARPRPSRPRWRWSTTSLAPGSSSSATTSPVTSATRSWPQRPPRSNGWGRSSSCASPRSSDARPAHRHEPKPRARRGARRRPLAAVRSGGAGPERAQPLPATQEPDADARAYGAPAIRGRRGPRGALLAALRPFRPFPARRGRLDPVGDHRLRRWPAELHHGLRRRARRRVHRDPPVHRRRAAAAGAALPERVHGVRHVPQPRAGRRVVRLSGDHRDRHPPRRAAALGDGPRSRGHPGQPAARLSLRQRASLRARRDRAERRRRVHRGPGVRRRAAQPADHHRRGVGGQAALHAEPRRDVDGPAGARRSRRGAGGLPDRVPARPGVPSAGARPRLPRRCGPRRRRGERPVAVDPRRRGHAGRAHAALALHRRAPRPAGRRDLRRLRPDRDLRARRERPAAGPGALRLPRRHRAAADRRSAEPQPARHAAGGGRRRLPPRPRLRQHVRGQLPGQRAAGARRQRDLRRVPHPAPGRARLRGVPAGPRRPLAARPRAPRGEAPRPLAQRRPADAVARHGHAGSGDHEAPAQRVRLRARGRAHDVLRRRRGPSLPDRVAHQAPEPAGRARHGQAAQPPAGAARHAVRSAARSRRSRRRRRARPHGAVRMRRPRAPVRVHPARVGQRGHRDARPARDTRSADRCAAFERRALRRAHRRQPRPDRPDRPAAADPDPGQRLLPDPRDRRAAPSRLARERWRMTLADQVRRLLSGASPPGDVLIWWGSSDLPAGTGQAPMLSQPAWEGAYLRLENGARTAGAVRPLPEVLAAVGAFRPDGPLPIGIARFHHGVPRAGLVARVRRAAAEGRALRHPPRSLELDEREAFFACGLLHDQWGLAQATYRGHSVPFLVREDFHLTNAGAPLPDAVELDPGDGGGFRRVELGTPLVAEYGDGATAAQVSVRCRYSAAVRTARFALTLSDAPAAPEPDETWPLRAENGNSGNAWVYLADGAAAVRRPVIMVEGFPGGHPPDYLYDILDQQGTANALRAAGRDIVLVGLDQGMDDVQRNAEVLVACVREAIGRTQEPLVVGGMSMGGLISRYALAAMEARGETHNTETFLTIDTPHAGTYTSLAAQWFVHACLPFLPALGGYAQLLDSPANQQFDLWWLHEGTVGTSPLREALVQDLAALGNYPRLPRRLAVSSGRGDGARSGAAGVQT